MDAQTLLQAVAGVGQANLPPGHRLATIDPAYNAATVYPTVTLPKVTFDGETTLSTKRYPIVVDYVPVAGDRVLMAPIGRTYTILGAVQHTSGKFTTEPGIVAKFRATSPSTGFTSSSTTDFALTGVAVSAARDYRIHLNTPWFIDDTGMWHCFIRVNGADLARIGAITSLTAGITDEVLSGAVPWQPATGSYNIGVYAYENTPNPTLTFHADAASPRELWVEDIGRRRT